MPHGDWVLRVRQVASGTPDVPRARWGSASPRFIQWVSRPHGCLSDLFRLVRIAPELSSRGGSVYLKGYAHAVPSFW
eukprot:4306346-Heterocapsa_arctica.AAC.1